MTRPPERARDRARRGFTLVELVVGLTVFALVAAAAYAAVAMASDGARRMRDHRSHALVAVAARASLDTWLRAANRDPGAELVRGRRGDRGAWPHDELLLRVADAGVLHPGPHLVRLYVGSPRAGAPPGVFAELTPMREGVIGAVDTLALAPAAVGLRLRYATTVAGRRRWLDEWAAGTVPPEAVELRIVFGSGGGGGLLALPLVAVVGPGVR